MSLPLAFCYAPVNGKQTEHDDSIIMRLSHQERKRPNNDDMFENCFYSLTWLSWIFPASYHPGLISSKRWRINILHSSPFSHDFLVVYFNRNVTSYFPGYFWHSPHLIVTRLSQGFFFPNWCFRETLRILRRYINTETTFFWWKWDIYRNISYF